MKFIRPTALILIIALVISAFVGCGKSYENEYIYFELADVPLTLDAQTASTDSELLIVRNIYEGLLRKDTNGKITYGAAESYTKDGLTYTFKLRKDIKWSSGDQLTANDFVFALRRAVSPETKAPFASRLFSVTNAKEIYSGNADVTALGVTATDEYTLVITLSEDDPYFEDTLTSSVCMPCNEKFFNESVGKYGLERQYVNSNGSYKLTKWNPDDFGIRLYKNEEYTGDCEAMNAAVFISCRKDEDIIEFLDEKTVDAAFLGNERLSEAKEKGIQVISVRNKCWVLSIDDDYDETVRRCLMMAVSSGVYGSKLPDGFTVANTIYPPILGVDSAVQNAGITSYDLDTAKLVFSAQVAKMEDKKFPAATLYYYDSLCIKPAVTALAGHWQQNLSAFVNIEASNSILALTSELKEPTLQFSVFPVKASGPSVAEYLTNFNVEYNGDPAAVQIQLLENNTLVPIAFEDTSIAYTSDLTTIQSDRTNGYIDFAFVIKNE